MISLSLAYSKVGIPAPPSSIEGRLISLGGGGSHILAAANRALHSFYAARPLRLGGIEIVLEEITGFFESILKTYATDPAIFIVVLFIYSILTALFLPFPVEIALFIGTPGLPEVLIATVIGLGKMVGSGAIFLIGLKVEDNIRYYAARYRMAGKAVGYITRFVRRTRWIGLFVLLSVPFFPDTVPIYLYSLFNKQGQLIQFHVFLIVNFLAGIARTYIFLYTCRAFGLCS